ncbi:hypothetical protein FisN_22Hh144 [Fistulifera solaris]|uniref:Plastid lipid-associated protein/fibrillin conserved domain-containing protein n=1 Tax=Fistulifera solaris TaxID=1519565 RepID=A0A1Z5JPW2_FISSO|nr:hypothetical protein FisN_22Hh144 [Fistulifera solaris]|eukprot:GAX15999.1 hypothetical protein FisN_22Hh144 [Fistulifera solaris]
MRTSFIRLLAIFSMNMAASGFLYANSGFPMAPSSTRWFHQSPYPTNLAAQKESSKDSCEFELQELRAQLNAMKAKGISSKELDPITRAAFVNYARQIVAKRPSPIALSSVAAQLPGSSWRLVFSTEAVTLGALPNDATVYLHFVDESDMNYSLRFSEKTFGLDAITAQSKWTGDARGVITFVYDKITTDVFGFKNVGVSFFGLLQGRSNCVQSAYFDGNFWIEEAVGPDGEKFVSVYLRDD